LKYVPETKIGKADRLSRKLDYKLEIENDNNQTLIKEQWIHSLAEIEGPEVDIVEKIKKARSKDEKIVRVVKEIKKQKLKYCEEISSK